MTNLLKLDFNERSDNSNPLLTQYWSGDSLWQYPERQPLEQQIANLNGLSPSQVLCTNGGDEAIMILMRIIKETCRLILPLPAFSQYTWGIESWTINAQLIPGQADLSIDINATLTAIKKSPGSVTIITRPNNPTGELIPVERLLNILETASENGGWVFLDEAYIEFSQEKSVSNSLLAQFDNLVILRTLSKAYGLAGIRLGYLLGAEKLVAEFEKRCLPFNIPKLSLIIAAEALAIDNQAEIESYCQCIKANRELLSNWLAEIGIPLLPSQANFVFLKLPQGQAKAVSSFLAKNNILVRTFGAGELENCLRITIPFAMERLLSKLEQCFQPQLVCLDMDGVLVDTSGSYDQSILATVNQLSGKKTELESIELLRRQGGFNNDWVLSKRLLDDLGFEFDLDKVTTVFQKLYLGENNDGLVTHETSIITDKLVSRINQSKICRFAIVTGRPRIEARAGQALVNLSQLDLISLDDVKVAKPSAEGIQKLQQKYSRRSWMCGDNVDDMQAAVASNSLAIGIGENKANSLYQAGADIVLKDINELEQWLCPIK